MGYRYDEFTPGEVYHLCTRGVEQRKIFLDDSDRRRFLDLLLHCLPSGEIISYSNAKKLKRQPRRTPRGKGLIDLLAYCLMDNHFHLIIQENIEGGTSTYMQRLLTSYAKYFNMKQRRSGSLFIHPFKAVLIDDDEQFLHVMRYVHLNPYAAHMVNDPFVYKWSSLAEYTEKMRHQMCHNVFLRKLMRPEEYKQFVADEAGYAKELAEVKHLILE